MFVFSRIWMFWNNAFFDNESFKLFFSCFNLMILNKEFEKLYESTQFLLKFKLAMTSSFTKTFINKFKIFSYLKYFIYINSCVT